MNGNHIKVAGIASVIGLIVGCFTIYNQVHAYAVQRRAEAVQDAMMHAQIESRLAAIEADLCRVHNKRWRHGECQER
jgi:predicted histidine transporter YuiF (NhaC family)